MSADNTDDEAVNHYKEFIEELNLNLELPKVSELLEESRFYNKNTVQNNFIRDFKIKNTDESKLLELIRILKLDMNFPLMPQL